MATLTVDRRAFLKTGAGAGLCIGFHIPAYAALSPAADDPAQQQEKKTPNPFNAWVHITPDNRIALLLEKSEMGQGIMTAVPMSVPSKFSDGKITVPSLLHRKSLAPQDSTRITCLTAYDYPTARLLDEAGVEVLLVGDSLGMVMKKEEVGIVEVTHPLIFRLRSGPGSSRAAFVSVANKGVKGAFVAGKPT